MRIGKTPVLVPKGFKLLLTVGAYILDGRGFVYALAINKYRNQKLSDCIFSRLKYHLFPFSHMVEKLNSFVLTVMLLLKTDKVSLDFTR